MSKDILRQIEAQIPGMTVAQKKVADYILRNTMEAAFSTIDKIAHAAGVSTTSVIRLANALDFKAFSEFQKALKEYMRSHAAPIHKLSLNTRDKEPQGGQGIVADVYHYELENMSEAAKALSEETLKAVASCLDKARNIYICGARTSESVARYLAYDLRRMFLNVTYVGEAPSEQVDLFKRIGPEDVLIAVTVSRYNRTVCHTASLCKKLGITVVAITDDYDSPLAANSHYQFIAKCRSNSFHNSIGAQIFLCDVLIKVCSEVSAERVRKNLKRDEEIVTEMQYFVRK